MRIGFGFDAHAFDTSRGLILGGVFIPDSPGLSGHSDADVLCHSIADALLGAVGLSDLGTLFPNDERWRDASSLDLLAETAQELRKVRWDIANIDSTVLAEEPRLAPYRDEMEKNIATALGLDIGVVSVKATTADGMGFTGRREGIAAMAVALVEPTRVP
jgi:2-C-methyl-D-erythritol 2,4-cyclodiphosphate synthase